MLAKIDAAKGYVYSWAGEWSNYFGLKNQNEQLAKRVNELENEVANYKAMRLIDTTIVYDNQGVQLYTFIPAEVVKNSTNTQNNSFIINVGSNHGIKPDMGVISQEGVVGVVRRVSGNFSTVMSVLNTESRISAKLKNTEFFGPLVWNGESVQRASLIEIPQHAPVNKGDTIVSSGYSTIFPEGIIIGTVEDFKVSKGTFHEIDVKLNPDFSSLRYVSVINMPQRNEIKELEQNNSKQ